MQVLDQPPVTTRVATHEDLFDDADDMPKLKMGIVYWTKQGEVYREQLSTVDTPQRLLWADIKSERVFIANNHKTLD